MVSRLSNGGGELRQARPRIDGNDAPQPRGHPLGLTTSLHRRSNKTAVGKPAELAQYNTLNFPRGS